jgi:tRNA pseudouridine55 synthase
MNGALLIHKEFGISSFGIIEQLQHQLINKTGTKKRDLPKMGHGGTLDPFATGLLVVLVGKGVKLARYFLGSTKVYEGIIRFGETTVPGDPTHPVSETSSVLPESLEQIQEFAHQFTLEPYQQIPPMYSAKKHKGKPLYELAREGIEVERKPRACHLYQFEILTYASPRATFRLTCSSGTYVRTLAQDLGRKMGSVAMLDTLHRTASGSFLLENAWKLDQILQASSLDWNELPCFVPFNQLLDGFFRAEATEDESLSLVQGRQGVLPNILKRVESPKKPYRQTQESPNCVAIFCKDELIAVSSKENEIWGIERVFT